ncbi:Cys-Gln thioester bond-forming surface protein, partial [Ligilactobacillus aviarius]|uniref:Cys-Gln thioester bond-forming surface protein n=2 Tax=Ligilactobacillus aviarius TaxID=1606 RepID=UPI0024BAEE9C
MKKGIAKSLYSFGTAVLAFGTLASAGMPIVSAATVSSSQAESAQTVVSASKKSQDSLSNAKQSSRILTSIASRQGVKSSANNVETQTQASTSNAKATQSSAAHSSIMMMRLDATKGSYMITGTMPNTNHPQDGWEAYGPQRNGEIVYCYDPDNYNPSNNNDGNGQPVDPNAPLNKVSYNRSDLWNGSEAQGYSAASVDKVAAVLYAGYPNNIGGKQHNGPISQSQVDQWYEQYCANHQMSTDPSASNYFSEAQYEYDMTQNAIWGVEGNVPGDNVPTSSFGNAYQDDPLSEALYNYATRHPLDAKNAAQNGVTLENAQGKPMGASDTLTVDPKTHESEGFQVKGGDVTLPTSTNGYHVVNAQGQTVTTLEPGETYHVVFSPSTDPAKVNMMCPYLHVATADYYHSDDPASTGINGQKPWQNMVGLTTNTASIAINFKMGSESSSIASTKSSVQSSVKSSSAIKSSSVKSSSAVKSSSKKSSSSVKSSSA